MRKLTTQEKSELRMAAMRYEFGNIVLSDGSLAIFKGNQLDKSVIGEPIYLQDGASDWALLPDGLYVSANLQEFKIENGVLASVGTAQIKSNQPTSQLVKQLQSSQLKKKEMSNEMLESEIDGLYAKMKSLGDTGESREKFGEKYQPTKENNTENIFAQVAKAREFNSTKIGADMTFKPVVATSNLTPAQQAAFLAEANALGIKTFVKTSAEKLAWENADLSLYCNLTPEQEVEIRSKAVERFRASKETEKLNKQTDNPTPLQAALRRRGWVE